MFLLEIDLHAVLLQLADGGQCIYGISGKVGDAFGDDQVGICICIWQKIHSPADHLICTASP